MQRFGSALSAANHGGELRVTFETAGGLVYRAHCNAGQWSRERLRAAGGVCGVYEHPDATLVLSRTGARWCPNGSSRTHAVQVCGQPAVGVPFANSIVLAGHHVQLLRLERRGDCAEPARCEMLARPETPVAFAEVSPSGDVTLATSGGSVLRLDGEGPSVRRAWPPHGPACDLRGFGFVRGRYALVGRRGVMFWDPASGVASAPAALPASRSAIADADGVIAIGVDGGVRRMDARAGRVEVLVESGATSIERTPWGALCVCQHTVERIKDGCLRASIIEQCTAAKSDAFDDIACTRVDWSVVVQRSGALCAQLCT